MTENGTIGPDALAQTDGERIAKAIRASGLSVQSLAEYLEVNRNTVGAWISGRQKPHPAMLKLIALRTRVPEVWLKTGNYPDTPTDGLTQVSQDG